MPVIELGEQEPLGRRAAFELRRVRLEADGTGPRVGALCAGRAGSIRRVEHREEHPMPG